MFEEYVSHIFCRNKKPFHESYDVQSISKELGVGPKFHTQKTTTKFSSNSLDISYAKDMFLNCVCSRFACAYQTYYLEEICREPVGGGGGGVLDAKPPGQKSPGAKCPGPKSRGEGETSWSKKSGGRNILVQKVRRGAKRPGPKCQGAKLHVQKSQGVERPSPKRRSPKSPGAKTFLSLHFMIVKLPLWLWHSLRLLYEC